MDKPLLQVAAAVDQ